MIYCRPFIDFSKVLTAQELFWYTDASGKIGYGGVRNSDWFSQLWPAEFLQRYKPSIEYMELFAVCVAVLLWIKDYQNQRICILL